jgi:hypothetical protein
MIKSKRIDFSRCSDEDVAELMYACYEDCLWLCSVQGYHLSLRGCYYSCPGDTSKAIYNGFGVCDAHLFSKITKPEIAEQCYDEIARRPLRSAKCD